MALNRFPYRLALGALAGLLLAGCANKDRLATGALRTITAPATRSC